MLLARMGARQPAVRVLAGVLALSVLAPVIGCSNPNTSANSGPGAPYGQQQQPSNNPLANMSTGKKVALLAGAAALYYMYKKHQNAKGTGQQGQYYRSKNGGVYYRDAQGTPHWVTPPAEGIQVPAAEAQEYEQGAREYGFRDTAPAGPFSR